MVAPMLSHVTRAVAMVRFVSSFIDLTGERKFNPDLLGRGLCRKWPREAKGLDSGRFLFCNYQGFKLDLSSNAESMEEVESLVSRQACRKLCSASPMLLADGVASITTLHPHCIDG